jgi:hypothetical protein
MRRDREGRAERFETMSFCKGLSDREFSQARTVTSRIGRIVVHDEKPSIRMWSGAIAMAALFDCEVPDADWAIGTFAATPRTSSTFSEWPIARGPDKPRRKSEAWLQRRHGRESTVCRNRSDFVAWFP